MTAKTLLISAVLFSAITAIASEAAADCYLNGVGYSTGTKVGPYTCTSDGRWRR
jgi:hypothetical protein